MLLALSISLLLSQAAPPATGPKPQAKLPGKGPTAYDSAKLYFLAGDLAKAQDWARRGLKREPKTCGPLNAALAEYNFLANHIDDFTPEQARAFLELDRKISPTVRGRVTERAFERWVKKPLSLAEARGQGDLAGSLGLIDQVLTIDPKNEEALRLRATLSPDAGR